MTNTIKQKIFNLRDEISKVASPIGHSHSEYLEKDTGDYAPKTHSSSSTDYGTATSTKYGHVKKATEISDSNTDVTPANLVYNFVTSSITASENNLKTYYEGYDTNGVHTNGVIENLISEYDFQSQLKRYSIAATYQEPNDYETKFTSLEEAKRQKEQDNLGIDYYTWSGHYQITPEVTDENRQTMEQKFKIRYPNDSTGIDKIYINGLLDIRRSGNMIIQDLYTTTKNANNKYILSGEKYTRTGILNNEETPTEVTWNTWMAAFIPYSQSAITINTIGAGINNMVLKETTAGYLIEWKNNNSYTLEANANDQYKIAEFTNELNTNTQHVFPNHLGGYQIIVTKNSIYLTSNKQKGADINKDFLNQTYFIPRAG